VGLGDGGVDVDRHGDHRHPDPAVRLLRAEVGEPSVVGPGPGEHELAVALGGVAQARAERRAGDPPGAEHVGVGEEHLGGHALAIQALVAGVGVVGGVEATVAGLGLPLLAEVLVHGPLELLDHPQLGLVGVELRVVRLVQVLAVAIGRRAGVAVGGDEQVPVVAHSNPFSWAGRRPAAKSSPRRR
jgi:hypothetical protein